MKVLITFVFASLLSAVSPSGLTTPRVPDALLGQWYVPSRQSTIEFFKTGDRYFARITEVGGSWQKDYSDAKGKIIISNLKFTGKEWSDGELIHPGTNSRFDVTLTLDNTNTATAVAYKGIRLLHRDFRMVRKDETSN